MTIEYKFVTGEKIYVEVDEGIGRIMGELDKELEDNEIQETSNHESLNSLDKHHEFIYNLDLPQGFYRENVRQAFSRLNFDEKKLIRKLYLNTKPMTQEQYANYLGVKIEKVEEKLSIIRKKLKILIEEK